MTDMKPDDDALQDMIDAGWKPSHGPPDDTLDRIAVVLATAAYLTEGWGDDTMNMRRESLKNKPYVHAGPINAIADALKEKLRDMVEAGNTMADNYMDLCEDDMNAWHQALADAAGDTKDG